MSLSRLMSSKPVSHPAPQSLFFKSDALKATAGMSPAVEAHRPGRHTSRLLACITTEASDIKTLNTETLTDTSLSTVLIQLGAPSHQEQKVTSLP